MADFGIEVSRVGEDVKTTALKNKILHSDYPLHKIAMEGDDTLDVDILAIDASKTIAHNLGYVPLVFLYIQSDVASSTRHLVRGRDPFALPAGDGYDPRFILSMTDIDFTIYVEFPDNVPDARSYNFHYYVTEDDTGL